MPGKKSRIRKDPNIIEQKLGILDVAIHLKVPRGLKATTNAMDQVCQAELRDDALQKQGKDDYVLSLDRLLAAFDTYLREWKKVTAGNPKAYDFNFAEDYTVYLLWQLRNVSQHHGGIVDKKCKKDYQRIMTEMKSKGIALAISMPDNIEVEQSLFFPLEDYKIIKECVFKIIERDLGKEDTDVFRTRSSHTDITITDARSTFTMVLDGQLVETVLSDAEKFGIILDTDRMKVTFPSDHCRFYPNRMEVFDYQSGNTLKVKPARHRRKTGTDKN